MPDTCNCTNQTKAKWACLFIVLFTMICVGLVLAIDNACSQGTIQPPKETEYYAPRDTESDFHQAETPATKCD